MTTTRWIGSSAAFVLTYACAIDGAWSADAPAAPTQPNATVGSNGTTPAKTATAGGQATKPAATPKSTQPTPKPNDDKNRDFKPSEDISEDMSVAYPSDI